MADTTESTASGTRNGVRYALLYFVWLMLAWTGAWLLLRALEPRVVALSEPAMVSAYWTAMKLVIWVAPALWLIRLSGRTFAEAFGFTRLAPMLAWGFGAGAVLAGLNIAMKGAFVVPALSYGLLNAVVTSPLVEEISFRGGVQGALTPTLRFALANTITSAMFVAAHCPGWYFQDRLMEMLTAPIGGALGIFLLGWVFGLIVHLSKTIGAGVIAHSLNNLTA